jgi:hypothetical protein
MAVMNHDDHSAQPDRDPAGDPDLPAGGDPELPAGIDPGTGENAAPFGLPVLEELPELAGLLSDLVAVDRLLARVIDTLVLLEGSGQIETATGVALEQWVSSVARRTGSDVRMLRCAVRVSRRLPSLYTAFRDGRVSWAQLRAVALRCDRSPQHTDLALDAKIADAIDTCQQADPDALARMVGWAIAELTEPPEKQPAPKLGDGFLHLQPRLDGTGGSVYGDLDAYGFALLDNVTAPTQPPRIGRTRTGFAGPTDPDQAAHAAETLGRQRLTRLLDRLTHRCPDQAEYAPDATDATDATDDTDGTNGTDGTDGTDGTQDSTSDEDAGDAATGAAAAATGAAPTAGPSVPLPGIKLLLRAELDTLLGNTHLPAQLLTTLAGGAMHLEATAARRLADAGADLRLIVTDRGRVVGVGRQTRIPPGWLRDAILALHDTCTAPGCDRAALSAEVDHAIPWDAGGHTDIGNCGPLCGHDNHTKETAGWRATGQPDGTRHWHHPRSGLKITTHPTTKRPPPRPGPPDRSRHDDDGDHDDHGKADRTTSTAAGNTTGSDSGRGTGGREPPRHPPPEHPPDD